MTTDIERGGIDVSSQHEPSYYEVALTNRQVVVAFVVLLTCLVAAFLAGVWIGRESAARAQEKLALLSHPAVGGAPASVGGGDKEKSEGQALQEFQFFADPRHRPAGAKPPATPSTAAATSTAAADSATPSAAENPPASRTPRKRPNPPNTATETASGASSESPANQAGEGEPMRTQQATPPAPASSGTDVVSPRPLPDAGAASPGKPRASREGRAAAASSGTAGDVVIQVFSSADKEQADRVRDGLVSAGLPAFLSPIAKSTQTMYRVRIGPFPSRAAAETVAEKVRREHKLDTWITPK